MSLFDAMQILHILCKKDSYCLNPPSVGWWSVSENLHKIFFYMDDVAMPVHNNVTFWQSRSKVWMDQK